MPALASVIVRLLALCSVCTELNICKTAVSKNISIGRISRSLTSQQHFFRKLANPNFFWGCTLNERHTVGLNDFSTTRGPIHAKFCMRAYFGFECVFSPFVGWRPPAGGKRRKWIFVTMGVNGEFLHFGGFWTISQQRLHGSTPNIICVGTMFAADVPPPPVVPIGPWGMRGGGLKTQKIGGWSHSCIGQLPFLFFSATPNVVQYVRHRPAHILV